MKCIRFFGISLFVSLFVLSCSQNGDIKEIRDFKDGKWPISKKEVFTFEIKDTSVEYQMNYLIRNAVSYPYYNLYLNQVLKGPSGEVVSSSMDEVILFEEKTGKPYGDGLGDMFDHRIKSPKYRNFRFPKPGKYKWVISHNMRPDPLLGILSAGIEVVPVTAEK
jgi:gliding motility-associated lipoprotein GldH